MRVVDCSNLFWILFCSFYIKNEKITLYYIVYLFPISNTNAMWSGALRHLQVNHGREFKTHEEQSPCAALR